MELVRGLANLRARHRGCVLTIGNYDGVHLGHRAVLADLAVRGRTLDLPATVMVFEPTPQEFFAGPAAPARLTTLREKLGLLADCGVDRVVCVYFNRRVASTTPQRFVDDFIVAGLGARQVTIGTDFRYGRDRAGDFETLAAAGRQHGFEVAATPDFNLDGERVSSSGVRAALARGDLTAAARLLGREFSMSGRVRHGERLGRRLGYPTANIAPRRQVLPVHGVFAVRVRGAGPGELPGVASIGTRPTVDGREPLLEVHLFDFDGDLYGRRLEVVFVRHLRAERAFADLHAMVEQMNEDSAQARQALGVTSGG